MSLEVRVAKEILSYEGKPFFGFSLRQIIFTVPAIILGGTIMIFTESTLGTDLSTCIILIACSPFIAFGYVTIHGYTFEKYLKILWKHKILSRKFGYKTDQLTTLRILEQYTDEKTPIKISKEKYRENLSDINYRKQKKQMKENLKLAKKSFKLAKREKRKANKNQIKLNCFKKSERLGNE